MSYLATIMQLASYYKFQSGAYFISQFMSKPKMSFLIVIVDALSITFTEILLQVDLPA